MPVLYLTTYECDRCPLPQLCAKCGIPSTGGVRVTVPSQIPFILIGVLLPYCPPLYFIVALVMYRWRNVLVPLCPPHQIDWRWRNRVTLWSVVFLTFVYGAAVVWIILPWPDDRSESWLVGPIAYICVLYAWFFLVSIAWTRTVRVTKAVPRRIRLSGVHPKFAAAVRDDRARDRDPARHAWFGDARDDFDDEPIR